MDKRPPQGMAGEWRLWGLGRSGTEKAVSYLPLNEITSERGFFSDDDYPGYGARTGCRAHSWVSKAGEQFFTIRP
jgi:hypothetical protein